MSIHAASQAQTKVWDTPTLVPIPTQVIETAVPVMSLNSDAGVNWRFGIGRLSEEQVLKNDSNIEWRHIQVPGEVAMQGHNIENDVPYYYKSSIRVPDDTVDKTVLLRFNGVYSKTRVWVNGTYIRSHKGGFTSWDSDITSVITPGEQAEIIVEFIDDIWDPSIGSLYAHHNIGGIISSVQLIVVPHTHITRLHYEVDFDHAFEDAEFKVHVGVHLGAAEAASMKLELYDANQCLIPLGDATIKFDQTAQEQYIIYPIQRPLKWDAEHPNLYTLVATLYAGQKLEQLEQSKLKVGFRKITYGGMNGTDKREVYINGEPIKLRGTCRHNIHPTLGRTTTPELDRQDVLMLRAQNVNYVRTSHYPPTKAFLEACDELGMYVEEETAVCFQYANGPGPWGDDEAWYMDQFSEMIERDKSHACIVIWSLANESGWRKGPEGDKFRRQYQYIKQVDTSRPTKFSYPFMVEDGSTTDIFSAHYANYKDNMANYLFNFGVSPDDIYVDRKTPIIHDEYAHIACYNLNELERDNNVRNFWGESIQQFWESIVTTHGVLGGALWANIDDVFHLPEGVIERHQQHSVGSAAGYGEWGNMSDHWRREKPEYWLTKKAYSPIRLQDRALGHPDNMEMVIPVKNWFNHTNLNEVQINWTIECAGLVTEHGQQSGPDVSPYSQGEIVLPKRNWNDAEVLHIQFFTADEIMVDEYHLPVRAYELQFEEQSHDLLQLVESNEHIRVYNSAIELVYSTEQAQLIRGSYQGNVILTGGPHLHLEAEALGEWNGESISAVWQDSGIDPLSLEQGMTVEITIQGHYANGLNVQYIQKIYPSGKLVTRYKLIDGTVSSALFEVGISFDIPNTVTQVDWKKKGLHSSYPDQHIGRLSGSAIRVRKGSIEQPDTYGLRPSWDWKDDMNNFYLDLKTDPYKGLVTRDFKSMRESVYYYSVNFQDTLARIRVESQGTEAVRVRYEVEQQTMINDGDSQQLSYSGNWKQVEDSNYYLGTATSSNNPGDKLELIFYGTGITLLYAQHRYTGRMLISVDDDESVLIDTFSDIGRTLYQQRYEIKDLALSEHKLTIEVPQQLDEAKIVIDAFEVSDNTKPREIHASLIINNKWNYDGLGWGNYVGYPIEVTAGYEQEVTIRLTDHNNYTLRYV